MTKGLWPEDDTTVFDEHPRHQWCREWFSLLPPCEQAKYPDQMLPEPEPKLVELLDRMHRGEKAMTPEEREANRQHILREHDEWHATGFTQLRAEGLGVRDASIARHCDECVRLVRARPNYY